MKFFAKPTYLYVIDKYAINNKVQDWFQHIEYCVTKEDSGEFWLNAATHIILPTYESFRDKAVY